VPAVGCPVADDRFFVLVAEGALVLVAIPIGDSFDGVTLGVASTVGEPVPEKEVP